MSARGSELSVLPVTRGQSPLWEASQQDSTDRGSFSREPCIIAGREKEEQAILLQLGMSAPFPNPTLIYGQISPDREQQIDFILLLPFRACCQPTQTPGPWPPWASAGRTLLSSTAGKHKSCSIKLRAASPAEQQGTAVADG